MTLNTIVGQYAARTVALYSVGTRSEILLNNLYRGVTTWLSFPPVTGVCTWLSLAGGTEVIDIAVDEDAPIVGRTIQEAVQADLLEDDALLIAIERGDDTITPQGNTEIKPNDIVTVFSPDREKKPTLEAFKEKDSSTSTVST